MEDLITVSDLMTGNPETVFPDDELGEVYALMSERMIRHVPVIDSDGNIEGVISHRDLIRTALYEFDDLTYLDQRDALKGMLVRDVMTTDPDTVAPDMPLSDAGRLLLDNKIGCLPVVEGNRLVGILTEADFIKHMVTESELAQAEMAVRTEIPH
jgi:CBS domain-containing membrane protein